MRGRGRLADLGRRRSEVADRHWRAQPKFPLDRPKALCPRASERRFRDGAEFPHSCHISSRVGFVAIAERRVVRFLADLPALSSHRTKFAALELLLLRCESHAVPADRHPRPRQFGLTSSKRGGTECAGQQRLEELLAPLQIDSPKSWKTRCRVRVGRFQGQHAMPQGSALRLYQCHPDPGRSVLAVRARRCFGAPAPRWTNRPRPQLPSAVPGRAV